MGWSSEQRYCRCGTCLAADNSGDQCARCERASRDKLVTPPEVPAEFWQTDQFHDAFAAQHIGRVARAYRLHPYHQPVYGPSGISQGLLGQWLGLSQPQVSRIENGPPIRNLDTLAYWARTLHIPPELLWFRPPAEKRQCATAVPVASTRRVPAANGGQEPSTGAGTQWAPTAQHLFADFRRLVMSSGQELMAGMVLPSGVELAEVLATPLDYLTFLSVAARVVPGEQGDHIYDQLTKFLRQWADTVNRRELLQLFGWAATSVVTSPATSGLDDGEQERLAQAIVTPSRVDERVIDHIHTMLQHCQRQEDALGPRVVLHTVLAQRQLVRALLDGCPGALRSHLLSVYSSISSSAGFYCFDLDDVDSAMRYCDQARAAAQEARNTDLATYALCNMSYFASWQGKAHAGIDFAAAAQSLVRQTDDILLRVCTAERTATAHAIDGQYTACMREFDRAQTGFGSSAGQGSPASPAYWYHEGLIASQQSDCLLRLGKPVEAAVSASTGLRLFDNSFVGSQAFCTLRLGTARLQSGEVEEAARIISDGALLATQNRSIRLTKEVQTTRARMRPWQDSQAARTLDEQLVGWGFGA